MLKYRKPEQGRVKYICQLFMYNSKLSDQILHKGINSTLTTKYQKSWAQLLLQTESTAKISIPQRRCVATGRARSNSRLFKTNRLTTRQQINAGTLTQMHPRRPN